MDYPDSEWRLQCWLTKSLEISRGVSSPANDGNLLGFETRTQLVLTRRETYGGFTSTPIVARVTPGGSVYHVLNRSVAGLPLFREAADYGALRADSDVHRQQPALRQRRLAKAAGRRSGMVAYVPPRRSAVEAEKLAAPPFLPLKQVANPPFLTMHDCSLLTSLR